MDPLHQQILDRLAGELDDQVFEDCACDLLRDIYPGLVPVRGGGDAGMDGAIADGEGEAFPLICTTRQAYRRNLVESLESFVAHGRRRRKVVFATSQVITPQKRRGLEDIASKRGFTLVQIVDRRGMANLLYSKSRWLQDLLGLSGTPSALSAVPRSRRPLLDIELVGRHEDLEWIRSCSGDCIVAGEPGSGKTYLFLHLIQQGWNGLFLVDEDRGEVKRALLDQRPATVVFDDAHLRPDVIAMLRQLREEMAVGFSLAVTTWTWQGDLDAVAAALPGAPVRRLRLLPRHEILEILKQAGIRGSDEVLRELVDQAANKPGLAATIAHLWKRGAWKEIIEGKALRQEVMAAFRSTGGEVEDLLAALSLGGDSGMGLEPVQRFLGLDLPAVRRQAAALAAGGILDEGRDGALSVWPRSLRTALLRTVFFSDGPPRPNYDLLLEGAPSFSDAIQELATVRRAGARIPELQQRLVEAGCDDESARSAWRRLARAGKDDAHWVLEHYPGDFLDVAYALLEEIPGEVIPRLLIRGADEKQRGVKEGKAMSLLASWIQELRPDQVEEALRRRQLVARAARSFLAAGGGDPGTGVQAICLALRPNQQGSSRDPGLGNTVNLWFALLPLEGLRGIAEIWEGVKPVIPALDRTSWQALESALWAWMHPSTAAPGAPVSEDAAREMPAFALRLLGDLIALANGSPGLQARLARLGAQLGASLAVELDPVFEMLYPEGYREDEADLEAARQLGLQALASEWARLGPRAMTERLAWYETEAQRIGYGWPRGSQELCQELAARVSDPMPWLDALVEGHLPSIFVSPFLSRIVQERCNGWHQVAEDCLGMETCQFAAVDAILRLPDAPCSLLGKALDCAIAWPQAIETVALRNEMPPENLCAALRHPRSEIALAAAVGLWCAHHGSGAVPDKLLDDWRDAVLRARGDSSQTGFEYWLGDILVNDPDLALGWLRSRVLEPDAGLMLSSRAFSSAIQALRRQHRSQLLTELASAPVLASLLPSLIGRDIELYRQLLGLTQLRPYHLEPLAGKPDHAWQELALLALDCGHDPERIAEAAVSDGGEFAGPGIEHWTAWAQAFKALEERPGAHPLMSEIGCHGMRIVEGYLQAAQSRQEEISRRGL
jgi:hypothetical protein